MGRLLEFGGGTPPQDHRIICNKPLRLRWGEWQTPHVIQVHVQAAALYEDQREETLAQGRDPTGYMPPHFTLDGGMRETAMAMLRQRSDEESLKDITYLSGLMECLLNVPCPVLRTDLIRRVYQEVETLGQRLELRWRGRVGHCMLPVMADARDPHILAKAVARLHNLQEFFNTVRGISHERYASLAKDFVIFYPRPIKALA